MRARSSAETRSSHRNNATGTFNNDVDIVWGILNCKRILESESVCTWARFALKHPETRPHAGPGSHRRVWVTELPRNFYLKLVFSKIYP